MTQFDFTKAHRDEGWVFLDTVWHGLEYLCEQVERAEKERAKFLGLSEEAAKNFAYCDFGNHPGDAMLCNYSFGTRTRFVISLAFSTRHFRLPRIWRRNLLTSSHGEIRWRRIRRGSGHTVTMLPHRT